MSVNRILSIPQWILTGSVSIPDAGYSSIYPKLGGPTYTWYVAGSDGYEKRLALDIQFGFGVSYSEALPASPYGSRIDIAIGGGLTYSSGLYSGTPIHVGGLTPSMLALTGSYVPGYILSTSTYSGEFQWVPNIGANILGETNRVAKFSGSMSLTSSNITDTGSYVYIGTTPSNTNASFSVDGGVNVGVLGSTATLYFGDQNHTYIQRENDGGLIIRTTDEFRVDLYTGSEPAYRVINFDNLSDEQRTIQLMNGMIQINDFTASNSLSASNLNSVLFGNTSSPFRMELYSSTSGGLKIMDGSQASYSVLVSDSTGLGTWQSIYGYDGLTTSGIGVGLNLVNIQGLTLSGGTFGLDYNKFALPLKVYDTFTISLATVSVITGITYGSTFETPTFRLDEWGRIIGIGTVSTSAFTGPQGPTGFSFVWQGAFTASSTYSFYNVVEYDGSSYISLGTSSPGLTPSTITQSWGLMASKGADGATGQGFTWQGTYSSAITYNYYDVLYYGGSSWISVTTSNVGNTPSTATQSWNLMVSGGENQLPSGTYGAVLVWGEYGWTALGPATYGYVLTTGGTSSLPFWSEPIAGSGSGGFATFSTGFTVSIAVGKSFGKYVNGDYIPSEGWTLEYFIYDVLNENLPPAIYLTVDSDIGEGGSQNTVPFGMTSINFSLNFGWTDIVTQGATVSSATLTFIDNGDTVYQSFPGFVVSDAEKLNDAQAYNENFIQDYSPRPQEGSTWTFKWEVTDSKGTSATPIVREITVDPYQEPTFTITVAGTDIRPSKGETNLKREIGNIGSQITGVVTRFNSYINVTGYDYTFREGTTGGFTQILNISYSPSAIMGPNNTQLQTHNATIPSSNPGLYDATQIQYIGRVFDEIGNYQSNQVNIMFEKIIYYGPAATGTAPTNKAQLSSLSLPYEELESEAINGQYITFPTGIVYSDFFLVIPSEYTIGLAELVSPSITSNIDTDYITLGANINIEAYSGSGTSNEYKVWVYNSPIVFGLQTNGQPPQIRITVT